MRTCQQLPGYQELLNMEITFEAKYYLAVGNDTHAEKLRDCQITDRVRPVRVP